MWKCRTWTESATSSSTKYRTSWEFVPSSCWPSSRDCPSPPDSALLGDPDQAVYDFQLDGPDDLTSGRFLDAVRDLGGVTSTRLTDQYRARSSDARAAATLLLDSPTGDQRIRIVRTFLSRLLAAGDVADLARPLLRWRGTTALLCRTNGEALIVAARLRQAGVSTTMRSQAQELPIAGWIGESFQTQSARVIRKSDVLALLQEHSPMPAPDAWRLLKNVERDFRAPDRLDLARLSAGLSIGAAPSDLTVGSGSDVIVSTIHRAKGLEFDNVVLVNPSELIPGSATEEDASVAYVAITRARDHLMTARCLLPDFLRIDKASGRWIIGGYKPWMSRGFEIRGVDSRTPEDSDVSLSARDYVGREVCGVIDRVRSTLDLPVYSLAVRRRTGLQDHGGFRPPVGPAAGRVLAPEATLAVIRRRRGRWGRDTSRPVWRPATVLRCVWACG